MAKQEEMKMKILKEKWEIDSVALDYELKPNFVYDELIERVSFKDRRV